MTAIRYIPALPTLGPSALLPSLQPLRASVFPFDRLRPTDGRARLYYLARSGIYHGLRALGVGPGDVVLMPSYHHGVEVEAVRYTGAQPCFYRVDGQMRADLDDAAHRALDPRVRALYLTHFVGWPQPVAEARALCDERDILLVEDCALALYSKGATGRPLGTTGDLAVFCLYKTLPVPHGGLALAPVPLPAPEVARPPLYSTLHHVAGAMLARAAQSGNAARAAGEWARAAGRRTVGRLAHHVQVGTQHLDPAELRLGASTAVERIAGHVDGEMVAVRRRRNFARLVEALGDALRLPPGLPPLGTCPLFFPLAVDDRRSALAELRARGVDAIDFWSTGDAACAEEEFPEAAALRRRVIEVPLHQDLDDEAIDAVAHAVKYVLAHE